MAGACRRDVRITVAEYETPTDHRQGEREYGLLGWHRIDQRLQPGLRSLLPSHRPGVPSHPGRDPDHHPAPTCRRHGYGHRREQLAPPVPGHRSLPAGPGDQADHGLQRLQPEYPPRRDAARLSRCRGVHRPSHRARAGPFPRQGQLARRSGRHRAVPQAGDRGLDPGDANEHQL